MFRGNDHVDSNVLALGSCIERHEHLHIFIGKLVLLLEGCLVLEKAIQPPLVHGLHLPVLVQDLLVHELAVGSHLSAVEVYDVFVQLESLYLLVQLRLVSDARVLDLLGFGQVKHQELLVQSEDVG